MLTPDQILQAKAISNPGGTSSGTPGAPTGYTSPEEAKAAFNTSGPSFFDQMGNDIKAIGSDWGTRADTFGRIAKSDAGPVTKAVSMFGAGAGAAASTIEKTAELVPGVKEVVHGASSAINWMATSDLSPAKWLGDVIGSNHALQTATDLYDKDPDFKDTIDSVANIARLGGDVQAIVDGVRFTKDVTNKIVAETKTRLATPKPEAVPPTEGAPVVPNTPKSSVIDTAKNITKDIVPTKENWINHEVTKALDLTAGDVRNVNESTGNEVGKFIADNDLIGNNVPETTKKLQDFYDTNYKQVRSEIAKDTTKYKPGQIPEYRKTLGALSEHVKDIPGLEKADSEITALMGKKVLTLDDVQRTKELLDEHISLYKATGDVKEGVAKKGLANLRDKLKTFIEKRVKEKTGADIQDLNNKVATSRSILEDIKARSTRGLSRSKVSLSDLGAFTAGVVAGGPVAGALAWLLKYIYDSPSFKLRFAKFLQNLPEVRKKAINQSLRNGIIPPEIDQWLREAQSEMASNSSVQPLNKNESNTSTGNATQNNSVLPADSIPPESTPVPSESQQAELPKTKREIQAEKRAKAAQEALDKSGSYEMPDGEKLKMFKAWLKADPSNEQAPEWKAMIKKLTAGAESPKESSSK